MKETKKILYGWCRCPKCGNPKMTRLRSDTILKNFPAYCKYCKQESVITIDMKKEPKRQDENSHFGAFCFSLGR